MLNCKADPTLKDYFKDKVHFADFLNVIHFHGQQVLSPEHLSVVDTDMSTVVEGKKVTVSFNRNRDVIMRDNQNGCLLYTSQLMIFYKEKEIINKSKL